MRISRRAKAAGSLLVVAAFLAIPAVAEVPGYTTTTAMVPVGDGSVRLDAKVYVPNGTVPAGGWPLIVRHHGGGSHKDNDYDTKYGLQAAARGFSVLMYSARGHGASEGSFDFFGPESVSDFSDVLDWVDVNVPSVDTNNVGTSGISQGGGLSLLPAALDPQGRVKAVAVGNTFDSLNHALNPNDCFKFSFATGIFAAAYKSAGARTNDDLAVRWGATWYTDTEDQSIPPWPSALPPPALPNLFPSTTSEADGRSPVTYVDRLIDRRIPVFWMQSWEDQLFPGDHPEKILGPLSDAGIPVHYWFSSGGHAVGPNDPADEAAKETALIDWFDQFLRGVDHGYTTGPKVDFAQRVPGSSAWTHKQAAAWPVANQTATLHADLGGWLGLQGDDHAVGVIVNDLANANIANDAIVSGEVPGRVPFTQVGQAVRSLPEFGTGADTVSFATAPLSGDVEVTGAPVVVADIAHTTAQTVMQINAKVWDVAPDGSATLINRGCWSGAPASEVTQSLWPNSHVFVAGHSIRLDIAAVDFPMFEADKEPSTTVLGPRTRVTLPVTAGSL